MIKYNISCSDGTHNLERFSTSEILSLSNNKNKMVEKIKITLGGYDFLNIAISLDRSTDLIFNISYHISGTEKDILYYSEKLNQWIYDLRPWYWRFYKWIQVPVLWLLYAVILLIIGSLAIVSGVKLFIPLEIIKSLPQVIGGGIGIFSVLVAILLYKLVKFLLPPGEFVIGEGIKTKRRREGALKFVLITIGISLPIGIIGSIAAERLMHSS